MGYKSKMRGPHSRSIPAAVIDGAIRAAVLLAIASAVTVLGVMLWVCYIDLRFGAGALESAFHNIK